VRGHRGLSSPWPCPARPHTWPRRCGPSWPWSSYATATAASRPPLPWRRCCGGPAQCCPCLAVALSLSRWLPGLAGTTPCGLGRQRVSACCRVGVTHRPCPTYSAQLPLPELGDLAILPCFSAIAAMDPPSSPTLSPPPHTNSRWHRVTVTWSTSSTLHLSFWSHDSLQLECRSDRAYSRSELPFFLDRHPLTVPGQLVAPLEPPWPPARGALQS
jgi:hypothetical protein